MTDEILATDRLILRRWRESDVTPYAAMCADAEVMRHIGDGSIRSAAETRASVARIEAAWDAHGFGLFALERRDDGRFIGYTGLSIPTFLPEVMPSVEIGWRLSRENWGQGLASEAAAAARDFAFERKGLADLVSIFQHGNHASARIASKIGMRSERETIDPGSGRSVHVYRIYAGERS
ncbi:GNAT family N-acetyltransferase [Sphingomicrobium arenosum]|uniref:GNAT family N-acetyltransferase n=1 Tax=Sphingomicrobium arenosum TaxID=2233861 RepID=UPI002240BB64|nr:GNAT family N-acetyltransferase [Sphingomicrobium arenosum]